MPEREPPNLPQIATPEPPERPDRPVAVVYRRRTTFAAFALLTFSLVAAGFGAYAALRIVQDDLAKQALARTARYEKAVMDAAITPFDPDAALEALEAVSPACAHLIEQDLAFVTPEREDRLRLAVIGDRCPDAHLAMAIISAEGDVLFRRQGKLVDVLPTAADTTLTRKALADEIEAFGERLAVRRVTLPAWKAAQLGPVRESGIARQVPNVDRETWENVRASAAPVVCLPTDMQSETCLTYSAPNGSGLVLMERSRIAPTTIYATQLREDEGSNPR